MGRHLERVSQAQEKQEQDILIKDLVKRIAKIEKSVKQLMEAKANKQEKTSKANETKEEQKAE